MPDTTPTTPTPVPDPALARRVHAALRAVGEGDFDLDTGSDYGDQTAAVLAELAPELAELLDYRTRIDWDTTCSEHARLLTACRAADERAEQAEAALGRVRDKATEWAALAPADDWGMTPIDTVLADAGRYLLALTALNAPPAPAPEWSAHRQENQT